MLSVSLVLGLCVPGPDAWAARGARGAAAARKAKVRKGPQPKLLLPAADAELEPGKVLFAWKVVAKLVRLEVARDEQFTDTVFNKPVKGRKAVLSLEPGTYYWRVTAPRKPPSDPRMLTVAAEPPMDMPEPQAQLQAQAQPEPQPMAAEGFGLDLTAATSPSATSSASSDAAALASAEVPGGSDALKAPTEPVVAEVERETSSSQRGSKKVWSFFIGGSAAYGASAPHSMAALRYEVSAAVRLANPFELSLAVGGTSIQALGTRDATWPYYTWIGQVYADLGGRYRLVRFDNGALYGMVAGRVSFFTGKEELRGFLVDRGPFSAGAGIAYRFRAGLPLELGLRGNVLTGNKLGGELELGLRVLVF